jgi:prepilin-type N-terminal cleavage/methylation domain-containing protein
MIRRLARDEQGFSIIEVLVVVAIIAILVAIVVASYGYSVARTQEMADRANLRVLRSAIEAHRADSVDGETYPAQLQDLYPAFLQSLSALTIPSTTREYEYDSSTGTVWNPDYPDR